MLISLSHNLKFRFEENDLPVSSFLHSEYSIHSIHDDQCHVDYDITFKEDYLPQNAYIVRPPVSYDQNGVFIFDNNNKICRIDYSKITYQNCHVNCDPHFNPNFFAIILEALIHCTYLKSDCFFGHASAFVYKGQTILCPAWRNTGKTNLLLSFLKDGADYLGDDWVLVRPDGSIETLPKRLNLFYYNFQQNKDLLKYVSPEFKSLVDLTVLADEKKLMMEPKTLDALKSQAKVRLRPEELGFNSLPFSSKIDKIFYLSKYAGDGTPIHITDLTYDTLANKASEITKFEQNFLWTSYNTHLARTGSKNIQLDECLEKIPSLVHQAFKSVPFIKEINFPGQEFVPQVKLSIQNILEGQS